MKESSLKKKIILGTAQLGMNYGLCKNNLYKSDKNIIQILNYARNKRIQYLDTARAYGLSEANIGQYHCKNNKTSRCGTQFSARICARHLCNYFRA